MAFVRGFEAGRRPNGRARLSDGANRVETRLNQRRAAVVRPRGTRTWVASSSTLDVNGGAPNSEDSVRDGVDVHAAKWKHRGFNIGYLYAGVDNEMPAPSRAEQRDTRLSVLLVHGFGANSAQFRKNLPVLGLRYRVYALCLLGFGSSEKPLQGSFDENGDEVRYSFETWSAQIRDFCREVVQDNDITLVANSIGAVAAMQAAVDAEEDGVSNDGASLFAGIVQLATSLRMLNVRKRAWLADITAPLAMRALKFRALGEFFFDRIQQKETLRGILQTAYAVQDAVDDELLEIIASPARDSGALDVFLAFISYDTGPIPEDLIPRLRIPTVFVWGELDSFEPLKLGRALPALNPERVTDFIVLPGVGHCPHDEAPELVNAIVRDFVENHARSNLPIGGTQLDESRAET